MAMKLHRFSNMLAICTAVLAVSGMSHLAQAGSVTMQTFDTDPVLADTQAPGVWYVDRYPPAGFSSVFFEGDYRLAHTVSVDDSSSNRPPEYAGPLYNTQGRRYDTPGAMSLSIDYYIDPALEQFTGRTGGFWGVGVNAYGQFSSYPIIEFFDNQFMVYDSVSYLDDPNDDGFGWREVGLPSDFAYGEFVNLEIELDAVNDVFYFYVAAELLAIEEAGYTKQIGAVILQHYNEGADRTVYWDNLSAEVPLPGAALLFLPALVGGAFAVRRRPAVRRTDSAAARAVTATATMAAPEVRSKA